MKWIQVKRLLMSEDMWLQCIDSEVSSTSRPFIKCALQWRHNEHNGVSNHGVLIVYLTFCSGADQRKHGSSALLAFVRRIYRWPGKSPHKGQVTQNMFPFDDVINGWRTTWKFENAFVLEGHIFIQLCLLSFTPFTSPIMAHTMQN